MHPCTSDGPHLIPSLPVPSPPLLRSLAYDGRGNAVVKSAEDIDAAVASLGGFEQGLYAEKWCPFVKELAVMVVRRCGCIHSPAHPQTLPCTPPPSGRMQRSAVW